VGEWAVLERDAEGTIENLFSIYLEQYAKHIMLTASHSHWESRTQSNRRSLKLT
jgi:hypothetical protein